MKAQGLTIKSVSKSDALITPVFQNPMDAIHYANQLLSAAIMAASDGGLVAPPDVRYAGGYRMTWAHRTIIVTAGVAQTARMLCEMLAGRCGSGMFQTALSADGTEPATHYVSSGPIEDQFADLLYSGAENIHAVVTAAGIKIPLEAVQQVMACADISDEPPESAFERLGLQVVQEGGENV